MLSTEPIYHKGLDLNLTADKRYFDPLIHLWGRHIVQYASLIGPIRRLLDRPSETLMLVAKHDLIYIFTSHCRTPLPWCIGKPQCMYYCNKRILPSQTTALVKMSFLYTTATTPPSFDTTTSTARVTTPYSCCFTQCQNYLNIYYMYIYLNQLFVLELISDGAWLISRRCSRRAGRQCHIGNIAMHNAKSSKATLRREVNSKDFFQLETSSYLPEAGAARALSNCRAHNCRGSVRRGQRAPR